jgi:DNA-binding XRE family transcriptional regulator
MRAMRLDAKLSLQQAAPKLDLTTSSLHRLETGETLAHVHIARSMMDLYDIHMPDLLDVIRAARRRGWWRSYQVAHRDYLGWETGATHMYEVATLRLPDLLQTEDYTRHLLHGSRDKALAGQFGDEIQTRRIRQARLGKPDGLTYTVILDESTLQNSVGDTGVMRDQLAHITDAASRPTVTVRVLPASAGPDLRCGGFRLLDFDYPGDSPVLYADVVDTTRREDRADLTESTQRLFDQIMSASLSPEASRDLIHRIATELYPPARGGEERKTA